MAPYERELRAALAAAQIAAALCEAARSDAAGLQETAKVDLSPVTLADYGAQALICRTLGEAFPRDAIVGEEESSTLQQPQNAALLRRVHDYVSRFGRTCTADDVCRWIAAGSAKPSDRFWTVDPLDGTKGFLRGGQYAIAIALIEGGHPAVGVLACPALPRVWDEPGAEVGMLYAAVRGQGAWASLLRGGPRTSVSASSNNDPAGWRLAQSWESHHCDAMLQEEAARMVGITLAPLCLDSQAKYAIVARGDAALYLRFPSPASPGYRENIWDHAAGALIVTEASGRATDMDGHPLCWTSGVRLVANRGLVVGSGVAHPSVLQAISALHVQRSAV